MLRDMKMEVVKTNKLISGRTNRFGDTLLFQRTIFASRILHVAWVTSMVAGQVVCKADDSRAHKSTFAYLISARETIAFLIKILL